MNVIRARPLRTNGPIARKIDRLKRGAGPRVVDLFSGCGGLSLGFRRAGFDIVAGIELDAEAASSHAVNFHDAPVPGSGSEKAQFVRDITKLDPRELSQNIESGNPATAVDVLIGGPPCQSYARVGRAKLREVADHPSAYRIDPRGNLYLCYLNYVRVLRPLVIVMENVPDVLNYGGHNVAEEIAEVLESDEFGYECRYTLLNAVHYGVPQMRERMFLVAYHRSLETKVRFPVQTHFCELPSGYRSARQVALKNLFVDGTLLPELRFRPIPESVPQNLEPAVTAANALGDLPPITGHLSGHIRRGVRKLDELVPYQNGAKSAFAQEMRTWPDIGVANGVGAHVIRSLPRDYKIFRRMKHGDQYPEAHARAIGLFEEFVGRCRGTHREVAYGTAEYEALRARFVPPYDPGKFPNKWRKMAPHEPCRTVMAHLGKDSYSHIHFDCRQARTISVREAARLQSFPDGFRFVGAMNAAFRQIGNAVPPLLAWRLAETIGFDVFGQWRQKSDLSGSQPSIGTETTGEPVS